MRAYYNEIEPFAAGWLRNLIVEGLIAPGDVDERDIRDVYPSDLLGYTQCHFFAGIGGWSLALRLAGWPDDRPVWTGSCPCQPFSAAGRRGGAFDERHLWPHWFHLIDVCGPPIVFGEQVASKDGLAWFDLVSADLEGAAYAVGAADLCAAGVGAPHIRQRLWFVGHRHRREERSDERLADADDQRQQPAGDTARSRDAGRTGATCELADSLGARLEGRDARPLGHPELERAGRDTGAGAEAQGRAALRPVGDDARPSGAARDGVAHTYARHSGQRGRPGSAQAPGLQPRIDAYGRGVSGAWSPADWLSCRDGKARPVEPGTFPLAHGVPGRVGKLRAYGNAIVPQVAAEFIQAALAARDAVLNV